MYNPRDHYWIVGGSTTQVYASARAQFVPAVDSTYLAWLGAGNIPTRIASNAELYDVLIDAGFPSGIETAGQDRVKDVALDRMDLVMFRIMFNMENRVRVLEGRPSVTMNQYRTAIKALL